MSWTAPPAPSPLAPRPPSTDPLIDVPKPQPAPAGERILAIDVVRGVALAGVLLANLMFAFRVPVSRGYLPPDEDLGALDRWSEGFVQFAIQGKAITLFSILFGVGLAIQFERFSRLGRPRYWLSRRLLVLLAFGLAHLLLVWNGDILTEYALAGLLVLPLLRLPSRALAGLAILLYGFYLVAPGLPFMPEWPDASVLASELEDGLAVYGRGSYAEIRGYSLHEWQVFSPIYLSLFTVTPALFLAGVMLWRSGVLKDPGAHRDRLGAVAIVGVLAGGMLTAFGSREGGTLGAMVGEFVAAGVAPAVLAMGYGAALLLAIDRGLLVPVWRGFAAAGRMAFTNYLVQSLVFTTLFFGYGLGLIGRVSQSAALVLGIALYVLQVAFSRWWLARFRFGPFEWIWRSLTYGRAQAFRR